MVNVLGGCFVSDGRVRLPGSERSVTPAGENIAADGGERIEATVVLRRRAEPTGTGTGAAPLSRTELALRYGADRADIERVRAVLTGAGMAIVSVDAASRRIRIAATVATMEQVFGTSLSTIQINEGGLARTVRHRSGELSVPAELDELVTAVLGLDDRPQADVRSQVATAAPGHSYTPVQLADIYTMPAGTDGTGQTVAIIELGGGFAQSDLDTYFTGLGLASPKVTAVGVDGATNVAGRDPQGADGEVLLDIEVVGAIAPKAEIVVYFAPNTDAGFLDAISTAAHASPAPSAISISWGQSEDTWTAQARTALDQACADAVLLGITVTAAAGDSGSSEGTSGAHVDFPASSPHVLACGGTSLIADTATGQVSSETVWNDGTSGGSTGGGISDVFPLPRWQETAGVPTRAGGGTGRGVPDVAADADPATGYQVYVDGTALVIGGTSAVAPLWAGFTARLAQALGKPLGLLQPAIYAAANPSASPAGFRDITVGNNGAYQAGPGWDACTGLGVPDGDRLLQVLRAS